ncbi:hypothetical protein BATDEDRAFT_21920 [Batrachochytrium dendrobatidis JAM81]|uniref:Phospholipase C n=3 Tax=Batrachochytrium dendrobatidis TaxID=109871 RepID=F4NRE4_BATDJ|nr:uncharacterized protein BATDEDRAFT_21920 [Batrachochytrium dendrobatidis JAM81]EGF84145.1 hypothetical protein BATDEDRAFT_21920 [Batrachochytrium dendrobatidis JAM81]|eukprot:XP_006675418.1 hypothetical protein BATDEDRAFT_21920 [Batrachochytrium dendrobatidis JAM81]
MGNTSSIRPKTGTPGLSPHIKHIVVLVMENRSFDNILGRLKWDNLNPKVNGLTGFEYNVMKNGETIKVSKGTNPAGGFNPGHDILPFTEQIYGAGVINARFLEPTMSGFADQAFQESHQDMGAVNQVFESFGPDTLPVTYALAQEFAVIDDWFSSVPGPTYSNRHFVHCATASGHTINDGNIRGIGCRTIFKNLDEHGNSWRVYADSARVSTLLYREMRNPKRLVKLRSTSRFKKDAATGDLPQYSFIDPDYTKNDNHPPNNLYKGEEFIKEIYEAIRNSPKWEQILFLITYDENGGFYDHVKPPTDVPIPDSKPPKPAQGDFNFDRLGPRVPTIVISPYVQKGGVFRSNVPGRYFEHSSIPATIKKVFGLPNYLTPRDKAAMTFDLAANLPFPRQDCLRYLPNVPT